MSDLSPLYVYDSSGNLTTVFDMGELLDRQHKFYLSKEQELLEKYKGQFIVIHGEQVVDSFASERDAYIYCVQHFQIGTFLIREVVPAQPKI